MTFIVGLLFLGIVGSLGHALFTMASGPDQSGRMVRALTMRVAFSIVLFGTMAAVSYVVLLTAYSAALKHYVIIDVLTLAAGFVLRAVAGAVAIGVPISHWLLVCTTLLALFIGLSKRRHELTLLHDGAAGHRPILQEYSAYLLDQMISVVTAATHAAPSDGRYSRARKSLWWPNG